MKQFASGDLTRNTGDLFEAAAVAPRCHHQASQAQICRHVDGAIQDADQQGYRQPEGLCRQ